MCLTCSSSQVCSALALALSTRAQGNLGSVAPGEQLYLGCSRYVWSTSGVCRGKTVSCAETAAQTVHFAANLLRTNIQSQAAFDSVPDRVCRVALHFVVRMAGRRNAVAAAKRNVFVR